MKPEGFDVFCVLSLGHAVFDEEPALIANEVFRLHFLAASGKLGLIRFPFRTHLFEMLDGQSYF